MSRQTITVERGGRDQYGDPAPAAQHMVTDVIVAPVQSTEGQGWARWSTTTFDLFPPPGADIQDGDTVLLADGSRWKVTGRPFAWVNPFTGSAPGGQLTIERVA